MKFLEQSLTIAGLFGSVIVYTLALPLQRRCKENVRPQNALRHIAENFMIVENALVGKDAIIRQVLGMKPRKRREVADPEPAIQTSSACPWKWKVSKNRPHEIPSRLVRAVCPGCAHYCQPIGYYVRVLVKDGCDPVSGVSVWRWKEKKIIVAYVMVT